MVCDLPLLCDCTEAVLVVPLHPEIVDIFKPTKLWQRFM